MAGRGRGRGAFLPGTPVPSLGLTTEEEAVPTQPQQARDPHTENLSVAVSAVEINTNTGGRGRGRSSRFLTTQVAPPAPGIEQPSSAALLAPGIEQPATATLLAPGIEQPATATLLAPGIEQPLSGQNPNIEVIPSNIPALPQAGSEQDDHSNADSSVNGGRGRGRGRGRAPLQAGVPAPGLHSSGSSAGSAVGGSSIPPAAAPSSVGTSLGVSVSAVAPHSGSSAEVSSSDRSQLAAQAAGAMSRQEVPEPPAEAAVSAGAALAEVAQVQTFHGDKGTKIRVMTNFLRVKLVEDFGLFEYKVVFSPHLEETRVRKLAVGNLTETLGKAKLFDGVKMYLPKRLPENMLHLSTVHPNEATQELKISLQLVNVSVDNKVQFYNVLIRKVMYLLKYTEIKRDFYNPRKVAYMEKHNLEIWPGYTTTIERFEGGLMLCLNSTFRVLRRDTVLDMLNSERQRNPGSYKQKMEASIGDKSVITRYNNKHYKITDIDWAQNPTSTFDRRGTDVTFIDFYAEQHGQQIFDKEQPLLISRMKPRKNDPRGENYFVSLVPEFCHQSGLTDEMRSNVFLMRDLIAHSRTTPTQRRAAILDFLESVRTTPEAKAALDMWGVQLDAECLITEARNIQGPKLQFGTTTLAIAPADFTREATTTKCFEPVHLKRWQIFCTAQDKVKGETMVVQYRQVAPPLGITFGPQPDYVIVSNRAGRGMPTGADFRQALKGAAKPNEIQFVVVILPMAKDDLYAAVKRHCLTDVSMPSQVILGKTLSQDKKLRAVMQKVALQINCKLGGSLWALNIPLKDQIMFVGIDSHHEPSQKKKSVLALVASLDNYCTQYYSRVANQTAGQESADVIRPMFMQALAAFFAHNQRYPDRIIIFRDGVGDGMLEIIRTTEVAILKGAAHSLCDPERLKFLFVVVQKRINERVFLVKGTQLENPAPGSVLDHTITRRGVYDFFLISQLVRQGTVGPSHFIVLDDSGENKPDLVQRLSYITSYMYYNWPGSVRVPAMCQYAHKLAMLVGQHLDSDPLSNMDRQLYYL